MFLRGTSSTRARTTSLPSCEKLILVWAGAGKPAARSSPATAASLLSLDRDLLIYPFQPGPWYFRIVGKNGKPMFGHGLRIVALAVLDHFQRKQVIGHHPGHFRMPSGGNEVGDIAGGLAAAA